MPVLLENKRAKFDYDILEEIEAGLELKGHEVKSLREKRGSLLSSRVIIRGNEAFVVGFEIPPYQAKNLPPNYEENRPIRLLLRKKEIDYLEGRISQKGLTIIPLKVYTRAKKIKMTIGLAKGKKKYEKREKIKEREEKRKIERMMKGNL